MYIQKRILKKNKEEFNKKARRNGFIVFPIGFLPSLIFGIAEISNFEDFMLSLLGSAIVGCMFFLIVYGLSKWILYFPYKYE